ACPGNGRAIGKEAIEQSPGLTSIQGDCRGSARFVGLLVIASDNHCVSRIPKGNRENASRFRAGRHRRGRDCPIAAPILQVKKSCHFDSAGGKPGILRAVRDQASSAGGEGAFAWQCRREAGRRERLPVLSTVACREELESTIDRIAKSDAIGVIPEG